MGRTSPAVAFKMAWTGTRVEPPHCWASGYLGNSILNLYRTMLPDETTARSLTEMQRPARGAGNSCPCLCKDWTAGLWGMEGSQLGLAAQLPHIAMELNPASHEDREHRPKGAGKETDVLCWKPLNIVAFRKCGRRQPLITRNALPVPLPEVLRAGKRYSVHVTVTKVSAPQVQPAVGWPLPN